MVAASLPASIKSIMKGYSSTSLMKLLYQRLNHFSVLGKTHAKSAKGLRMMNMTMRILRRIKVRKADTSARTTVTSTPRPMVVKAA